VELVDDFGEQKDREDQLDTEDIAFRHVGRDYEFGEWCTYTYEKSVSPDETEQITEVFARHVWPEAIYRHVDEDEHGVRFVYRSHSGQLRRGVISADAFSSKSSARKVADKLSKQGVRISVDSGVDFAYGLGHWMEATDDAPIVRVTDTPGWHRQCSVYVNGDKIFGVDRWYANDQARAIGRRSGRRGMYEKWVGHMERLVTTDGLRAAYGVSLAGPLVEMLHPHSFIAHFYGASSSGKSTGGEVGASIWGTMHEAKNSWYGTTTSKENLAEIANGACLVLDELGQFQYSDEKLAEVIYNISSDQGKTRSTQSGDLQEQRSWKLTCISTGEISMKDAVGHHRKGGQDVRMLDIPIDVGDMTESRQHSNEIKRIVGEISSDEVHAGVAGDRWIDHLCSDRFDLPEVREAKRQEHDRLLAEFGDGSAETDRILQNIALVAVAMYEAHIVDSDHCPALAPWPVDESRQAVDWMARRAIGDRDARNPNERAIDLLREKVETEPSRFPMEPDVESGDAYGQVWGIMGHRQAGAHDDYVTTGEVYVSEKTLKASGLPREAGIGVRGFLRWCCQHGHATREDKRRRRGGVRCRWYHFASL